jgi:hypothetical protein
MSEYYQAQLDNGRELGVAPSSDHARSATGAAEPFKDRIIFVFITPSFSVDVFGDVLSRPAVFQVPASGFRK